MAAFFRGTFEKHRLDKKARVSVPAEFRNRLKNQPFEGIVAFPSLRHGSRHKVLECSGADRLDQMSASIDPTQVMPGGTSQTIQMLLGQARDLAFDGDGRIVLPDQFVTHLGAPEQVTFVGQGPFFEMWEAGAFTARAQAMLQDGLAAADKILGGRPVTDALPHRPVMVREVLEALNPRAGALYIDATFGGGGYSAALLDAADCRVFGIDRDPRAAARAQSLSERYRDRLTFVLGRFGDMLDLLKQRGVTRADGVAFDLGVSSPQIDDPARGFSFRADGPLDMRMGDEGPSAAEIVNTLPEATLADILYRLGEERRSRAVARAIVAARAAKPIARTLELADIVRRAVGHVPPGIDAATRSFQAIRIYTNDELGELDRGLSAAEILLNPGGRLAVVAFHSLEDRAVKSFLRSRSGAEPRASRHMPIAARNTPQQSFRLLFRGALTPSADEVSSNPRARSARLRAAERTSSPATMEAAA